MLIRKPQDIPSSAITDEPLFWGRREWLASVGMGVLGTAAFPGLGRAQGKEALKPHSYDTITGYNNYYEFGTDKEDPKANAQGLKTSPWTISVEGHVKTPAKYSVGDLFKGLTAEERIYRFRCVEGWSMVAPWLGYPLRDVIKRLEPGSRAKYVEFTTLLDPAQMPGQRRPVLEWPYVEGLRMDEAMHPLTLLVTGVYGKPIPNQNGAPVRLITPWKYGFKGGKSIVRIRFVETQPNTTWNIAAPNEYGFYANVNPTVDHPRWSQATERPLGQFFKKPTLMFNGYADQVASLYSGMDLRANY
jgi:methionine sulfoxide reductase catalytic subunit